MFIPLVAAMMIGMPGDEPPVKKELFATEDWYKSQEGKEQTFEGVLKYQPRPKDTVGFGRYNPFTLLMEAEGGKRDIREVFVGGQEELLKPYAGRRVRITGKPIDMEVEGTMHREIWPARLEQLPEKK